MGRHTDPAAIGSRRAAVLTLIASALLVAGGIAILRAAGDLRIGPSGPSGPATPSVTLTSPGDHASEPGRTPSTSAATPTVTTRSAAITTPPRTPVPTTAAPGATRTPSAPTSTSKPAAASRHGMGHQLVALVNVERSRVGGDPVSTDAALARAAQRHSDDMAARDIGVGYATGGTYWTQTLGG